MKIAIMQPYLLPYIGYWQLIEEVDKFVIFDDVNFIKKGYIQKNSILIKDRAHIFNLELQKVSQNKLINEIEIGFNASKILKTINMSYQKAPFFTQIYPMIENIFTNKDSSLSKFIGFSLEEISQYLGIETEFIYSSDIDKNESLKSQDKILDICKHLKAKIYVNSIGGKEMYNKKVFLDNKIALKFLKPNVFEYKQFGYEFVPNLSIIDILMFNDIKTIKDFLNRYSLV